MNFSHSHQDIKKMIQLNKIRNEREKLQLTVKKIKRIIRGQCEKVYDKILDNQIEMDKFLELNQEEIENLNIPITSNKIERVINNSQESRTTQLHRILLNI